MYQYPTGTFLYQVKPYDTAWLLSRRYNTTMYALSALNPGIDLSHLYTGQVIRINPGYGFCMPCLQSPYPPHAGVSKAALDLINDMRMLWEQHVVWTRLTIISIVENLPDVELVTKRLLRNPKDFENALEPFYGNRIASEFNSLLTSHLTIAADLVKAAKAGDSKAAAKFEKEWYANADEIASFLGSINPYWPREEWRKMLYEHLSLTKSEAVDLITKKYKESIEVYDKIEMQALEMADMMAEGIIKQFEGIFISFSTSE